MTKNEFQRIVNSYKERMMKAKRLYELIQKTT